MTTYIEEKVEEFQEKVNEVRRETHWGEEQDSPLHEFGLKTQRGDELFTVTDFGNITKWLQTTLTETDRRARENWLRSEIEKLEEEILEAELHYDMRGMYETKVHCSALTSIITRYKEELKVLESK